MWKHRLCPIKERAVVRIPWKSNFKTSSRCFVIFVSRNEAPNQLPPLAREKVPQPREHGNTGREGCQIANICCGFDLRKIDSVLIAKTESNSSFYRSDFLILFKHKWNQCHFLLGKHFSKVFSPWNFDRDSKRSFLALCTLWSFKFWDYASSTICPGALQFHWIMKLKMSNSSNSKTMI